MYKCYFRRARRSTAGRQPSEPGYTLLRSHGVEQESGTNENLHVTPRTGAVEEPTGVHSEICKRHFKVAAGADLRALVTGDKALE